MFDQVNQNLGDAMMGMNEALGNANAVPPVNQHQNEGGFDLGDLPDDEIDPELQAALEASKNDM